MEPKPHIEERALLLRLREGEGLAFERIYEAYKRPLAKNLLRLLRDEALAQDALQDLFMNVWNSRHTIDPDKPFRAYLYRIAQHLVVDHYRKAAADERLMAAMLHGPMADDHSPESRLIDRERLAIIQEIIDRLPEERRAVFRLHKIEGLSHKEIAELLDLSAATISKHIHHGNRFIRQYLARHPELLVALCLWGL